MLERKERGRLGSAMSGWSLEGGDIGRLESLGEHEWLGLLSALVAAVWYDRGVWVWCV